VRVRIASPEPRAALLQTFAALGITDVPGPNPGDAGPEALYSAERSALAEGRVIPLVHEMESCGLSATLRDWMAMDTGEWRLDDVWLSQNAEGSPSAPAASGGHP
jgi:hypothetical protein